MWEVIYALLWTCEKRLLNEHGVKMQAAKQVLVVLKPVSAGCFSLSEDMARVFLQNMSRDLGKLREMLKKKTRVKALDYLSRVGLLWLFISIWLCCSLFVTRAARGARPARDANQDGARRGVSLDFQERNIVHAHTRISNKC